MNKNLRIACFQVNAGDDFQKNFAFLKKRLAPVLKRKLDLVAFPEVFLYRGKDSDLREISKKTSEILDYFCTQAKQSKTAFLLGSHAEAVPGKRKVYNTSYLIDEKGKVRARYRKIHLFDISMKKKKVSIQESKYVQAGKLVVMGKACGIPMGLSICYDLRFPELYRSLTKKGARILFIPANFTKVTGKAHWETLLRARAIENQAFVIAPGQCGKHPATGVMSYGNSMVVSPWGEIMARQELLKEGISYVNLSFAAQDEIRRNLPSLRHCRL